MPGGFPLGLDLCRGTTIGSVSTGSLGTQVNCGASANTVGGYTQLIAATAIDTAWMLVHTQNSLSQGSEEAVNIAIGAAGSEKIIASNLIVASQSSISCASYSFPCQIKAGTRISASAQGNAASDNVRVEVILFEAGFSHIEGAAGLDGIGFSGGGKVINPPVTIDTKGPYTQLIAATARDYIGYLLAFDTAGLNNGAGEYLMDLSIGAAGAEVAILSNLSLQEDLYGLMTPNVVGPIWQSIPAGIRISARCQNSRAATLYGYGLVFYGIYQ
jgi:hypothetical protein